MPRRIKHGFAREGKYHPLYSTWSSMRGRCRCPTDAAWKYYGGLGVKVCKRWDDFTNFITDVGKRPPGTTLDRYPDPHGDYKPSNVRWATGTQQNLNQRQRLTARRPPGYDDTMTTEHLLTAWRMRQKPEMSQSELSRRLGMNRTYLARVENGQRQIGVDLLPVVYRITRIKPELLRPDLAKAWRRATNQ